MKQTKCVSLHNTSTTLSTGLLNRNENMNPSSDVSVGRKAFGSILHNLHYNYGLGLAWTERQYYNANYVTYRGKGSGENTEVFEARKY